MAAHTWKSAAQAVVAAGRLQRWREHATKIISAAGLSYLVTLQLFSRIATFALNLMLSLTVDTPDVLGWTCAALSRP